MTYNLPLLRKERDWVAEQRALPYAESQLEMNYWFNFGESLDNLGKTCGTTYCVAGHIAAGTDGVGWRNGSFSVGEELADIAAWARKQLGIDPLEAAELFYSSDDSALAVLDKLIAKAESEERNQIEDDRA
jgi:hypothetical protein